jgi:hypothetical protein
MVLPRSPLATMMPSDSSRISVFDYIQMCVYVCMYIYISLQDLIRKTHMHRNDANKGKVNATCTVHQKAIDY